MDEFDPGGPDDDASDEATAAFEALGREVNKLRRFAAAAVQQRPDYTPTLASMAATLTKIEGHPALKLTPQAHAQQLRAAQGGVQRQGEQSLASAVRRVDQVAADLARMAEQARAADLQNRRLRQVGLGGLVIGAVLWAGLSGPVARTLPAGWAVPQKMAATMDEDRATAGQHMIASVNSQEWADSLGAIRLFRANREALTACGPKTNKGSASVGCTINVESSN